MKKLVFGALVTALALGMTVTGCARGDALQGTWVYVDDEYSIVTFEGNTFQFLNDGNVFQKGTYGLDGNNIIFTVTHRFNWWADELEELDRPMILPGTYSVAGDALILTFDDDGETAAFTRRR